MLCLFNQRRQRVITNGRRYRNMYFVSDTDPFCESQDEHKKKEESEHTSNILKFCPKYLFGHSQADVEKITQKDPNPEANINQLTSRPFYLLFIQASTAPKKEIRDETT